MEPNLPAFEIDIQHCSEGTKYPDDTQLKHWVLLALKAYKKRAELCLRIVDRDEMQALNHQYRHKNKPTNVLSFPADLPLDIAQDIPLLGDIVLCADVINTEAQQQGKTPNAHWAHMVIHGVLHLLGYDHVNDSDASVMEQLEIRLLQQLNITNPYGENV